MHKRAMGLPRVTAGGTVGYGGIARDFLIPKGTEVSVGNFYLPVSSLFATRSVIFTTEKSRNYLPQAEFTGERLAGYRNEPKVDPWNVVERGQPELERLDFLCFQYFTGQSSLWHRPCLENFADSANRSRRCRVAAAHAGGQRIEVCLMRPSGCGECTVCRHKRDRRHGWSRRRRIWSARHRRRRV